MVKYIFRFQTIN